MSQEHLTYHIYKANHCLKKGEIKYLNEVRVP